MNLFKRTTSTIFRQFSIHKSCNKMIEKYVGNNLKLSLTGERKKAVLVVGNNCRIDLENNISSIKIVGNGGKISVLSGEGKVIYIGNNGAITLDQGIDKNVVTYVGNNGKISTKNGSVCADSLRKCEGEAVKVVNLSGNCIVSKLRTKNLSFPTISLPNIEIQFSTHTKQKTSY